MTSEAQGHFFEDLQVGQQASRSTLVTEQVIIAFAEVSGDRNPVHLDAEFAARSHFKERIAHGMLSAGLISAVHGMDLPGLGAIYVSQTLNFKAPVRIGDTVVATVKIIELMPKRRVKFTTICTVCGAVVVDGEAIMMVPGRKSA